MINVAKSTFRSIEVENDGKVVRVDEGNVIKFVSEQGEAKTGEVTKISGKEDKAKLQILPSGADVEEIWSVLLIKDGTLEVIG